MNITFDIETTGLPQKGIKWERDYNRFPYIASISWKKDNETEVKDFIIKPRGYEIPESATKIHGISTSKAMAEGVDIETVLGMFITDCIEAKNIVAHNAYFDISIVKANILRCIEQGRMKHNWKQNVCIALDKSKRIDTMMKTIKFCSIPFPNGKGCKWPTLEELYMVLFREKFSGAHNSKNDVLATERCFKELVRRGIIKL